MKLFNKDAIMNNNLENEFDTKKRVEMKYSELVDRGRLKVDNWLDPLKTYISSTVGKSKMPVLTAYPGVGKTHFVGGYWAPMCFNETNVQLVVTTTPFVDTIERSMRPDCINRIKEIRNGNELQVDYIIGTYTRAKLRDIKDTINNGGRVLMAISKQMFYHKNHEDLREYVLDLTREGKASFIPDELSHSVPAGHMNYKDDTGRYCPEVVKNTEDCRQYYYFYRLQQAAIEGKVPWYSFGLNATPTYSQFGNDELEVWTYFPYTISPSDNWSTVCPMNMPLFLDKTGGLKDQTKVSKNAIIESTRALYQKEDDLVRALDSYFTVNNGDMFKRQQLDVLREARNNVRFQGIQRIQASDKNLSKQVILDNYIDEYAQELRGEDYNLFDGSVNTIPTLLQYKSDGTVVKLDSVKYDYKEICRKKKNESYKDLGTGNCKQLFVIYKGTYGENFPYVSEIVPHSIPSMNNKSDPITHLGEQLNGRGTRMTWFGLTPEQIDLLDYEQLSIFFGFNNFTVRLPIGNRTANNSVGRTFWISAIKNGVNNGNMIIVDMWLSIAMDNGFKSSEIMP